MNILKGFEEDGWTSSDVGFEKISLVQCRELIESSYDRCGVVVVQIEDHGAQSAP